LRGEAFLFVLFCGFGDWLTTSAALSLFSGGFVELNRFFFPFLSTLIFSAALLIVELTPLQAKPGDLLPWSVRGDV
jgi:hypothetical protein